MKMELNDNVIYGYNNGICLSILFNNMNKSNVIVIITKWWSSMEPYLSLNGFHLLYSHKGLQPKQWSPATVGISKWCLDVLNVNDLMLLYVFGIICIIVSWKINTNVFKLMIDFDPFDEIQIYIKCVYLEKWFFWNNLRFVSSFHVCQCFKKMKTIKPDCSRLSEHE